MKTKMFCSGSLEASAQPPEGSSGQLPPVSRCPLLVECQVSVFRGDSTDKGQRGAVVYRWNAALNRWTECHAVLLTALWPTKPHFYTALRSKVAIFEREAVRSRRQKTSGCGRVHRLTAPNSLIKGSKNVGFHPLRAISRGARCKFH
jgi:hypothetical protein